MQVWAQWNHPFDMPSAIWGRFLGFSCPEFPLGSVVVSACSLMAARWQVFFSFLSSLRAHGLTHGGLQSPMAVTSLFTDMAENAPSFRGDSDGGGAKATEGYSINHRPAEEGPLGAQEAERLGEGDGAL